MIARPGNGPALVAHLEQFTLAGPEPDLALISAPTLILWGRADRVIPVDRPGCCIRRSRGQSSSSMKVSAMPRGEKRPRNR